MISSFFSKTKPINYAIVLFFLLVFYLSNFVLVKDEIGNLVIIIFFFIALLLQVFVVQEIIRTRKTTNPTSFAMLFFVLLCMAIPKVISAKEVVFCNFFLILALNRLLALKSLTQVKQRIFDASLWICVASIFDPWALFFLLLVFLAVYVYGTKEFKSWLVPIVAISFFTLLITSFLCVTKNLEFLKDHYLISIAPNFFQDFISNFSLKPFLYIAAILAIIIIVFVKQGYQGVGRIVHLRLLMIYFLVSVLIFCIQNTTSNNYMILMYSFFPAAVFATNFLETIKRKRLKEIVLLACLVVPFALLFVDLIKK